MKIQNKISIQRISKIFLWASLFILFFTSIAHFVMFVDGLVTYLMYFLIGIILFFVLIRVDSNPRMIWNFPIVSGLYFLSEFFNAIYYPFFPATYFFPVYSTLFIVNLIFSMIIIHKDSIPFDVKESKALLIGFLTILAIGVGYWMQELAYDGLL